MTPINIVIFVKTLLKKRNSAYLLLRAKIALTKTRDYYVGTTRNIKTKSLG